MAPPSPLQRRLTAASAVLLILTAVPLYAGSSSTADARFVLRLRAVMSEMIEESRDDADRIREAYESQVNRAAYRDRAELVAAAESGALAPLPIDSARFNVRPRMTGPHPIGEKDLSHQPLYAAAHPGALGLLLHIASRVQLAPLEVTSLVRHGEYQRALARTNPNARTDVPTHALGVAFDISVLNVPIPAARELRDVLRRMRDEGDLFFLAERNQLVFHVVPAPERLEFYAAVFEALTQVTDTADTRLLAALHARPPRRLPQPPSPDPVQVSFAGVVTLEILDRWPAALCALIVMAAAVAVDRRRLRRRRR